MAGAAFEGQLREAREDPGALDRLLESYRHYLRLLARAWLHRSLRAKMDGSDAVQEALIRAHAAFGQFRGGTEKELAAWLRKALARTLMNFARRFHAEGRAVQREESLEAALEESASALGGLVLGGESPSSLASRREMGLVLADAMSKLSSDHREVIVLRSLQEMEWSEVAKEMGRSAEAERQLWVRALAELRPLLEAGP
jgi:RNA polymerase sigma-70 factor (ECF subfamily)